MKRSLWSKLLTTALGTAFIDQDSLFIEHTLLVVTAEIIGHAVVGFDPADPSLGAATLVRGQLFTAAQIRGVVEEDFFDWVVEVEGGPAFIRTLARRLARFAWGAVEHDVMKVLYESVIGAGTRKSLGEYYTRTGWPRRSSNRRSRTRSPSGCWTRPAARALSSSTRSAAT